MSRVALAMLALALGGCLVVDAPGNHMGGATSDAGPDADLTPISSSAACGEIAMVACMGYESCCDTHSASLSDCITALQTNCDRQIGPLFRDMRTGYDPEVAAEVIVEGMGLVGACDTGIVDWYNARTGLERVFQGTLASGEVCATMSSDPGAYFSCRDFANGCIGDATTGFHCDRRGVAMSPCHTDEDCVEADYCEGTVGSNPIFGLPGHCRVRLATGSACTVNGACASYLCDTNATHLCVDVTQQTAFCGLH